VPTGSGYQTYSLLSLLGFSRRALRSVSGHGHAPLHFITTRSPYQDGETVLDMRYDTRVSQIVIAEWMATRVDFWERRERLLDLLRPSRAFSGAVAEPAIYRKWLPSGSWVQGTDLQVTDGSDEVVSETAKFVSRGMKDGATFYITAGAEGGAFEVLEVINDYTLQLDHTFGADQTNARWAYRRGRGVRDLYFLLEQGPDFDRRLSGPAMYPQGYTEVLRLVSHDPFWYGEEQYEEWTVGAPTAHLVFRESTDPDTFDGGYFGETAGSGTWYFAQGYVGEATTIYYKGSAPARPTITITGPAEDPIITHDEQDLTIEIDGGRRRRQPDALRDGRLRGLRAVPGPTRAGRGEHGDGAVRGGGPGQHDEDRVEEPLRGHLTFSTGG